MRTYGLVVAYPPGTKLQAEGLGVVLVRLIAGMLEDPGIRIVIACPGWLQSSMRQLLREAQVTMDRLEIRGTRVPYSVRWLQWRQNGSSKIRPLRGHRRRPLDRIKGSVLDTLQQVKHRTQFLWAKACTPSDLAGATFWSLLLVPVFVGAMGIYVAAKAVRVMDRATTSALSRIARIIKADRAAAKVRTLIKSPRLATWILPLFNELQELQIAALKQLMSQSTDVESWLCPTAFWPALCKAPVPIVVTVPDITPVEFIVGFASLPGALETIVPVVDRVRSTARQAKWITVYSEHVRHQTLLDRLGVGLGRVRVVRHGTSNLSQLIQIRGTSDDVAATDELCRDLFWSALHRTRYRTMPIYEGAREWRFILYPSQFRPNKNIVGLLEAYQILLRRHLVREKLVLTAESPSVGEHVVAMGLQNDVVVIPGLSDQELAACYRLASLAISPTLAEGACPFMIAESLSVGTPVIVSDIPVTRELLEDDGLRRMMCFDPYRTSSIVERTLWALSHRDELIAAQRPLWERMRGRTWSVAAREYLAVMDEAALEWKARSKQSVGAIAE